MKLILSALAALFALLATVNDLIDWPWGIALTIVAAVLFDSVIRGTPAPTWRESHRRVKRRPYSD